MVAASISVFILTSVLSFVYFFKQAQYEYQTKVKLTNDARLIIDKLVWGVKQAGVAERRGISEAVRILPLPVAGASQLDYFDVDGTQHTIRYNNGNIQYRRGVNGAYITLLDPNGTPGFDPNVNSVNILFLQPASNARLVIVNIILGQTLQGRWYYASLSTQVFLRNS